jgi:hypothetical protein
MDLVGSFEIGVRLKQRNRLSITPIRCLDALLIKLAPNICDAAKNMRRNRHVPNLLLHLCQLAKAKAGAFGLPVGFQHPEKAKIFGDIVHHKPKEKTVVKRRQLLLFGELIAGAEKSQQRNPCYLFAVVKQALVNQSQ